MEKETWDFIWDYDDNYEWMDRCHKLPPLIITCAADGGIQGKEVNPAIPETPEEIAASAYDAYNAGASIVHIHARAKDKQWMNTNDWNDFYATNLAVRSKCKDIIINNSTGGGYDTTMQARLEVLDAKPEMASLNVGPSMERFVLRERGPEFVHPHPEMEIDGMIPFTYGIIDELAEKMLKNNIKPEIEVSHPGHYWVVNDLIRNNLLKKPYYIQFVMGVQTSSYPTPMNVIDLLKDMPGDSTFCVCGLGKYEWPLTTLGIILGGHVRVGLEDNINLSRGVKLQSNAEAVEKIVRIAKELGREIATPAQAREMLGISATPSSY